MVGLGLFAPLPLAVMIPFMAGQSFAMGEAFGKGFQYGKRRISSMTNEKFNSMSANDHFNETTADITAMIPTMSNAIDKFHTLQTDIILKMIDYIAKLPAEALPAITSAVGDINFAEIIESVVTAGAKTSGQLIEQLTKAINTKLVQTASASVDTRPDTSTVTTFTTAQQALDIANKATLRRPTPTTVGPFRGEALSPAQKSQVAAGVQIDTRVPIIKKLRAPKSLHTELRKRKEEVRVGNIKYQILTSRSGVGNNQRKNYNLLYKVGPMKRLTDFIKKYSKYQF